MKIKNSTVAFARTELLALSNLCIGICGLKGKFRLVTAGMTGTVGHFLVCTQ